MFIFMNATSHMFCDLYISFIYSPGHSSAGVLSPVCVGFKQRHFCHLSEELKGILLVSVQVMSH